MDDHRRGLHLHGGVRDGCRRTIAQDRKAVRCAGCAPSARALGADRWAADARGADAALAEGITRPRSEAIRHASDDLPHLADQEYTMVARSRARLVRQTLAELEDRFPALRRFGDAQRERTAEDIAHIVDFLATALYVDDPELFTEFLIWSADILEFRQVPARSLVTALEVLAGQFA